MEQSEVRVTDPGCHRIHRATNRSAGVNQSRAGAVAWRWPSRSRYCHDGRNFGGRAWNPKPRPWFDSTDRGTFPIARYGFGWPLPWFCTVQSIALTQFHDLEGKGEP